MAMRRPGHYGDSGGNAYVAAQMQHMSGQRMEHKSGNFQGRPESLASEKDHSYGTSKAEGHWRWERDGQGGDASRSYYQGQRPDPRMVLEKEGLNDPRSQPREEDMDIGYEDNLLSHTFEGLEQKFHDDIMKLSKDQTDAEDAENARHRERINTINTQYEDQLAALRARHASRKDEFLRRESHGRQQQYQKAAMDHYPNTGMHPNEPRGYGGVASSAGESLRAYNADNYDSYREHARFLGNTSDRGFEPRGQYPGSRAYDTGSRYY